MKTLSAMQPKSTATRCIFSAMLGLMALYLAIWPHELGHSLVAYLFGCKANWWQTSVTWFLWNSQGGAIDYDRLQARGGPGLGLTASGGIVVNLLLLALAAVAGRWWRSDFDSTMRSWLFLATFFWALANYAEAFSYVVWNTIWLRSDMAVVVTESGISRWIWLACGFLGALLIGKWLNKPAHQAAAILASREMSGRVWMGSFAGYVGIASTVMAIARIRLT